MRRNKWFKFKQFRIEQQKAAMKVGTDGVLIGAWVSIDNVSSILDVGTGTGLIALMLAQRSSAQIDAVEIDSAACTEAEFNFEQSPWRLRLKVIHSDFNTFSTENQQRYDLIVSNPPYFADSLKTPEPHLAKARHDVTITFADLIKGSARLLNEHGRLALIIPFHSFEEFRESARLQGFYLRRQTTVITKEGKSPERVLLEFSLLPCFTQTDKILVHTYDGQISQEFIDLTSPYYLNY